MLINIFPFIFSNIFLIFPFRGRGFLLRRFFGVFSFLLRAGEIFCASAPLFVCFILGCFVYSLYMQWLTVF